MADVVELAQAAYQAYGETTGFKNYRGDPMPAWDDLGDTIQQAWIAATAEVHSRFEYENQRRSITRFWDKDMTAISGRIVAHGGPLGDVLYQWLIRNGIDPAEVPRNAGFNIHDGQLTVEVVVLDDGCSIVDDRGFDGVKRTTRTVPLVEPFPVKK